jgi:hypothetical protein
MIRTALALLFLLGTASSLCADDGVNIRGAGALTCGEFAKASDAEAQVIFFSWAQGFMTGVNNQIAPSYRDLGGDTQSQLVKIGRYCIEHPGAIYADAVFDLYRSLPMKRMP